MPPDFGTSRRARGWDGKSPYSTARAWRGNADEAVFGPIVSPADMDWLGQNDAERDTRLSHASVAATSESGRGPNPDDWARAANHRPNRTWLCPAGRFHDDRHGRTGGVDGGEGDRASALFADAEDKMNLALADVGGALLVVSQFTLYGDARKGRRPSFIDAARPEIAIPLYERFVAATARRWLRRWRPESSAR